MTNKNIITSIIFTVAIATALGFFLFGNSTKDTALNGLDSTPKNVTLTGTYTCLPHLETEGPQTMECAFGLKAENGDYYAVNFGASGESMDQFRSGETITAEGFVVIKEALSSSKWQKYNMKGIFTITKILSPAPTTRGKININVICEDAAADTRFASENDFQVWIKECKEGKNLKVIEVYKIKMGLGADVQI